ncbi:MAG: glycoside hydrolase family 2 protein [Lachnospiraceae bacterium]|nr:glycoside hydrolase family 2 protein [Lachnospiraceae bacterium]
MITRILNDGWFMAMAACDDRIPAKVPGSVYSTLLDNGLMDDPFYRDNELAATRLMDHDYSFVNEFSLTEEELHSDRLILHFDGIDTIADVYLDNVLIGKADNMNRVWEYDISDAAGSGKAEHILKVVLHSPTKYIEEEDAKIHAGGSPDAMVGFPHIRKAACMFGWDWGPRLPDAGLFRTVKILAVNDARIENVCFDQKHNITGTDPVKGNSVGSVELSADIDVEFVGHTKGTAFGDEETARRRTVSMIVMSPDREKTKVVSGKIDELSEPDTGHGHKRLSVTIDDPELWWPNGYGEQPLYAVEIILSVDGKHVESRIYHIGLRTCTVNTDSIPDEQHDPHMENQKPDKVESRNFAFEVNGLQIFTMGADYIPEDAIITRQNRQRTAKLIKSAKQCNMNSIRVWGGGYFMDDYFYDLCDENGILVWQDFLFACACYELDDKFEDNIVAEIRDNVRRLRHHACIGIWCGNNEMETQTLDKSWGPSTKQVYDYIKIFEYIIPKVLKREDPERFYWPSSPSSGGNYENAHEENIGDTHYWGVWHGCEPFTAYRSHHYRFMSEFGFQSFPCLQTIESFTEPEDRNVFSRVMEMHQRNSAANGKIMNYMSQTYKYPGSFDDLIYCSQLLQADAIRYGVEHFRRFRGTCMGTVVWQLNDNWPVASWAGIDYYGRWKALQYAEKRMFAPILISCEEHGETDEKPFPNSQQCAVDFSATLHVANETGKTIEGMVMWTLRMPDGTTATDGGVGVTVEPYSGTWLPKMDFDDIISEDKAIENSGAIISADKDSFMEDKHLSPFDLHLSFELVVGDDIVSQGSCLFVAPKHYHFDDPALEIEVNGNQVAVTSHAFAKSVAVESPDGNLRLDDNFFDMEPGTRVLTVVDENGDPCAEEAMPAGPYRVRSVYGTWM